MDSLRNNLNHAIDYQSVLEQISQYASFSCSANKIEQALPLSSVLEIQYQLELTKECISLWQEGIELDFQGSHDVMPLVESAMKQIPLAGKELVEVATFLAACDRIKQSFLETEAKKCKELAQTLESCRSLKDRIFDCVDMNGDIKDHASPALKKAIGNLSVQKNTLSNIATRFVKKHGEQLQEKMSTSIQGRTCVLVKAQYKNSFGGLIHGQSQSGQAFYVEPSAFSEANNAIQSARLAIEEEKARICRQLTKEVSRYEKELVSNLDTMTQLDTALAKAKWAIAKDGCIPLLQTRDRSFQFLFARHPLIDEKMVVSNDYSCPVGTKCILISGANMGGKTVSLKTMALFMVLAHAGFPVVAHKAIVPFYDSWYFDIGDRQSIENNLSTFSGHISKVATICKEANAQSFVLLDEPGNGTDPSEGACLAQAVIEYLMDKGCTILTSTHYSSVKSFGKTHPEILVSSMEFDEECLKPTYKYIPMVSGASYAFDVANLYDLESSILARAKALKEENSQEIERKMEQLEHMQQQVRQEKERFQMLIADAHRLQKEADQTKEKIQKEKANLDEEYRQQLNEYLSQKKEEAKEIVSKMRKESHSKVHEQLQQMHQLDSLYQERKQKETNFTFKVGDYVKILSLNSHGEIVELRKKEAIINTGGTKIRVKTNQLEPMKRPQEKFESSRAKVSIQESRFPMELNIIGYRVEEGLQVLNHYIDQAVAHKVGQVRIIHGMGSGTLRRAVWKDLDKHPLVKSKQAAAASEGGLGATIVVLK